MNVVQTSQTQGRMRPLQPRADALGGHEGEVEAEDVEFSDGEPECGALHAVVEAEDFGGGGKGWQHGSAFKARQVARVTRVEGEKPMRPMPWLFWRPMKARKRPMSVEEETWTG
ncbi:hypothetical protein Scep_027346 [Stephania cephalantha]|uniref:Uncharacterized protein n=1 Tax=Stephania cephalantha TaxID=152367 RepID=A0AAP0E7Y6_9MAGN